MGNIREHMRLLGLKVRDKVTNLEGVVVSVSFDLYGCIQVVMQPEAEGGRLEESRWFDVTRLEVLNCKPVMRLPNFDEGYVAEGRKGPAEKPKQF